MSGWRERFESFRGPRAACPFCVPVRFSTAAHSGIRCRCGRPPCSCPRRLAPPRLRRPSVRSRACMCVSDSSYGPA
eukprot:1184183-Prymnesium_polylepis.1